MTPAVRKAMERFEEALVYRRMVEQSAPETSARRHWFHLGEIMPQGAWLAVVTFENGNESLRPCKTRREARAYARMQHAYGDVRTTVRKAR
jgi:hypothetical protein